MKIGDIKVRINWKGQSQTYFADLDVNDAFVINTSLSASAVY